MSVQLVIALIVGDAMFCRLFWMKVVSCFSFVGNLELVFADGFSVVVDFG